jgi:hypothetical protein
MKGQRIKLMSTTPPTDNTNPQLRSLAEEVLKTCHLLQCTYDYNEEAGEYACTEGATHQIKGPHDEDAGIYCQAHADEVHSQIAYNHRWCKQQIHGVAGLLAARLLARAILDSDNSNSATVAATPSKPMCIPAIGDVVKLTSDWEFRLYEEGRNKTLLSQIRSVPTNKWVANGRFWQVTIPVGTKLKVERVYIRAGQRNREYNSVTFRAEFNGKSVRFWAKLADVNKMMVTA